MEPAKHAALAAELRARLAAAARGGPERARERHAGRGKLLPRDRVDALTDPGSPFLELSPLAANGMYGDEAPAAGLIAGVGRVSGRECVIVANDATVKGGTYYPMTVRKHQLAGVDDKGASPASSAVRPGIAGWLRSRQRAGRPGRVDRFPELAGQRHTARRPLDRIHRLGYQFIERGVLGGLIRKAAEDVAGE